MIRYGCKIKKTILLGLFYSFFVVALQAATETDSPLEQSLNKCYLLRHGLTDWSWKMIPEGPQDLEMNEEGRRHVEKCAGFFQSLPDGERVSEIYTSPLKRCLATAKIVQSVLGDVPVYVVNELKEVYHGDWSTHRQQQTQALVDDAIARGLNDFEAKREIFPLLERMGKPADAENWESFKRRATQGIENCLQRSNVLVIAHGALFKVFLGSKGLYERDDIHWALAHRPPLVVEYQSVSSKDGWKLREAHLQD